MEHRITIVDNESNVRGARRSLLKALAAPRCRHVQLQNLLHDVQPDGRKNLDSLFSGWRAYQLYEGCPSHPVTEM